MYKEKAPMTVGELINALSKFDKNDYVNIQDRDLNMFDINNIDKFGIETDEDYFTDWHPSLTKNKVVNFVQLDTERI